MFEIACGADSFWMIVDFDCGCVSDPPFLDLETFLL